MHLSVCVLGIWSLPLNSLRGSSDIRQRRTWPVAVSVGEARKLCVCVCVSLSACHVHLSLANVLAEAGECRGGGGLNN